LFNLFTSSCVLDIPNFLQFSLGLMFCNSFSSVHALFLCWEYHFFPFSSTYHLLLFSSLPSEQPFQVFPWHPTPTPILTLTIIIEVNFLSVYHPFLFFTYLEVVKNRSRYQWEQILFCYYWQ
jgi:hypothetical protein